MATRFLASENVVTLEIQDHLSFEQRRYRCPVNNSYIEGFDAKVSSGGVPVCKNSGRPVRLAASVEGASDPNSRWPTRIGAICEASTTAAGGIICHWIADKSPTIIVVIAGVMWRANDSSIYWSTSKKNVCRFPKTTPISPLSSIANA